MNLNAANAWLGAHARRDVDCLRMSLSLVAKHERRGPSRSYDGQIGQFPENPPSLRDARVEPVVSASDAIDLVIVEGPSEIRLTMSLASMGDLTSETGLLRSMREILGDPPTHAGSGEPPPSDPPTGGGRLGQLRQHAVGEVRPAPAPPPPPRELRVDPASAITCVGCGLVFTPDVTLSFTGPDTVRVDGMTLFPCCSGPREPTIVRGREDEAPESGVYLAVDPGDE